MLAEEKKNTYSKILPYVINAVIVLALFGFSWLIGEIAANTLGAEESWFKELAPKGQPQIESFEQLNASNLERARLKDQLVLLRVRSQHHLTVALFFFMNYYMAILQAFVMGSVAASALFFIAKDGYGKTKSYVITVFVTATVLTTIFGAFPSVFRQSENVADNKYLYLKYIALQNEMLSYGATGMDATLKKCTPAEFIAYIDKELNQANNVAVGFDASKIPVVKFDIK